jgi:hypothetical protein
MILSAVRGDTAVSFNGHLLTVLPESDRAEVEAVVAESHDVPANFLRAGFTVMVDDKPVTVDTWLAEALLLEHGQHDQKSHGRKGYRGDHGAPGPEYGERMDQLGSGELIPADIRNRSRQMQLYGTGMPESDRESFAALNAALEGGPNTPITVYRAVPVGVNVINRGDWVTPSRTYAEMHAAGNLPAGVKGHVLAQTVPARSLWWNGDSINEWGYQGPRLSEAALLEHGNHNQKSHGRRGAGAGVSSEQIAKLDAELRTIRGAERLVALDPATGEVKLDIGDTGNKVGLTLKDDLAIAGSIASHNHPLGWENPEGSMLRNGSGPSTDDLMTAWRAGPAEMRIVGPTQTFSVKAGKDTWGEYTRDQANVERLNREANAKTPWDDDHDAARERHARAATQFIMGANRNEYVRLNELNEIDYAVRTDFMARINQGTLTPARASAAHHEEVLIRAAEKYGWEVEITREPSWVDPNGPTSALGEARLLEHPGHGNQKVHGRRGGITVEGGGDRQGMLEVLAQMGSDPQSLGTMGKILEANGVLTSNPAAVAASATRVGNELRHLPVEQAALIFPNGDVYKGPLGTSNRSEIPAGLQQFASVDIHNHPSGSAPSPTDINVFDSRVPKTEVRVVTPDGDYSITPGPNGWGDQRTYERTANEVYGGIVNDPANLFATGVQQSMQFWEGTAPAMGWSFTSPRSSTSRADSFPALDAIFTTTSSLPQP